MNCICCNKEAQLYLTESQLSMQKFHYCKECLENGIEPYEALITSSMFQGDVKDFDEGFLKILKKSIKVAGKTLKEFSKDCAAAEDAYIKYSKKALECFE